MKKLLLTGIAALSVLAASAAHAGQRPRVIVGKPRIITTTIKGVMLPPPKYDKPYDGELEIVFFSNSEDVKQACFGHDDAACAARSVDGKKCSIRMLSENAMKHKGENYAFALRHELGHCNGWKHPNSTNGRKFSAGDKWDEAEGAKWIAENTKMPVPKLPASTRVLPASPPVICVTPDWQKEPCESRKAAAVEAETDRRIKQSPNTETYEGLWRWCREHPNTVATECTEL